MDVIWKHLSDNHPSCRRLSLYSQSDPGTGATFAVRCNSLVGVTSEENFLNDAMYLIEGVLPLNETLQTVEIEWSFLSHLEEDDRDNFIRGIASLKKLEEISIRGAMSEESRLRFRSLLQIPECAKGLKHLAIELDEVHVEDPAEMGLAALLFLRCQHLESFHIRGLMPAPNTNEDQPTIEFDCSILLSALGKLPMLHTIHMSRNEENPKTVNSVALRDVCSLPTLESLSLMNMGLNDKHCKIFRRTLHSSPCLHSLILVDNPGITEKGNKALLRLLEKNRSIYNSTFGTDSETIHRTAQLVHLHLNRCGRAKVQSPTVFPTWLTYISRINETVPEELELDTLLIAVQENPEMIVQHCADRDTARQQQQKQKHDTAVEPVNAISLTPKINGGGGCATVAASLTPKKLPTRKDVVVLDDWEAIFPLMTSRDSIDSIMSPPQPFPRELPPHMSPLPSDVQPKAEDDGDPEQHPDDLQLSPRLSRVESSCTASTGPLQPIPRGSALSAPVRSVGGCDGGSDTSSSWDEMVGGWVDFERTTNVIFERLRDETCWGSSDNIPKPSRSRERPAAVGRSVSTPC